MVIAGEVKDCPLCGKPLDAVIEEPVNENAPVLGQVCAACGKPHAVRAYLWEGVGYVCERCFSWR